MFQPQIYKLFNNDLKNLNNNQLILHWKSIGIKEKRISNINSFFKKYPNFDINLYIQKYPNIKAYDELIIMSHYHHNLALNNDFINKNIKVDNDNNIINKYLNEYYIYKNTKLCVILFEINNNILSLIKDIKNIEIYLIISKFENNYFDNKNLNVNIFYIDKNIYNIQNILLNLKYDYFYFVVKNFSLNIDYINKNPNIIYHENFIIISKKILKYNFFFNYFDIDIKNSIDYSKNNIYQNYKFHTLLYLSEKNYMNSIYLDIDVNNYNDIFYILKLINYLEYNKYNIILKKNNFLFFNNYFIDNLNDDDYNIISDLNELNYKKNFIINTKLSFKSIKYNNLHKINIYLIKNIFENLLFLDLKKDILFINLHNISEEFIINSLINIDFTNCLIIIDDININKNNFNILNYLSTLNLSDFIQNLNYDYQDFIISFGLFVDFYIGENNLILKNWNFLNNNLICYLNKFDKLLCNNKNIIINNNLIQISHLNYKIIDYNSNIYLIDQYKINNLNKENFLFTDYYFNDYIFKYFFSKNINFNKDEKIFYDTKLFIYNNKIYLKYYQKCTQIFNDFYIKIINKKHKFYNIDNIQNNIINRFIFVIKLKEEYKINYFLEFFNKYFSNKNYILEFYFNNKITIKVEKKDNFNINIVNFKENNNNIFIDIKNKYNCFDMIYLLKNNDLIFFDINKDLICLSINNKFYINRNDYICFNLDILNYPNDNINKLFNINKDLINDINYNLNYNIKYYTNNQYFNKCKFDINDSLIYKFLIYSENYFILKNNNHQIYDCLLNNEIKFMLYYINNNILKIYDKNFKLILKIEIDTINFNIILNKININYFIFYDFSNKNEEIDEFNIYKFNNFKLENQIIYDNNHLKYYIIDFNSLKKIGFINDYYIKNYSMILINILLFSKIIHFNIYKINLLSLEKYNIDFSTELHNTINNINTDSIYLIRSSINLNKSSHFDNFFNIYIINLKHRIDKNKYMTDQMDKLMVSKFQFFDGIKITKDKLNNYNFIKPEKFLNNLNINYVLNSSGCKISHYQLINKLKDNDKYTIILEDDVVLEFNFRDYILTSLKQLIDNDIDFDILYLGCNLDNKNDAHLISSNVLKIKNAKTTTAYIINNRNKNKILNAIDNSFNEIDNCYSESNLNKYCIYPMIAYQKDFKSDITTDFNYIYYHDKYNYEL